MYNEVCSLFDVIGPRSSQSSTANHERRTKLFRERTGARLLRCILGLAYILQPKRIGSLPHLLAGCTSSFIRGGVECPSSADTWLKPDGFSGLVRAASPATLLDAHRAGYFVHAHVGPLKWWTRRERYVLSPGDRQIPSRLKSYMRKSALTVTFDKAFDDVVKACAEARPGRPRLTWIRPDVMHLYAGLHDLGYAHSFELWDEAGQLVGGGYGVAIGRVFVTESLFSRVPNASKMGFHLLNYHLERWGFVLNDVKDFAPHFDKTGFRHISREVYDAVLRQHAHVELADCSWQIEADLAVVAKGRTRSLQ